MLRATSSMRGGVADRSDSAANHARGCRLEQGFAGELRDESGLEQVDGGRIGSCRDQGVAQTLAGTPDTVLSMMRTTSSTSPLGSRV
jgi:hypothetical protein